MNIMRIQLGLLFFISAAYLMAQTELPKGQIEVVKDFEVRLMETKKIRIIPHPIIIDSTSRQFEYKLLAPSPSIEYIIPELKPLAIEPGQKPTYYPLFAKAGYGSPNSFLGQVSYDYLQNEIFDWGLDFKHLSANNKKLPLQKFSESSGRINGSYLMAESIQLEGYIDGQFENHYFYGASEIPTNPDALMRSFKRYDINFEASNSASENPLFQYKGLLQYFFDKDDLGTRERTIKLGGEVQTLLGKEENPIGIKALADLSKMKDVKEKSINNILVEPFFKYHSGNFKIHLGGIVLLKTDNNEVLPAFELSYKILPLVMVQLGWQGEVFKNNFHYLSSYNPYVSTRIDSIGNMISRRLYAGVKGVSGNLNFELTCGYTKFKSMAFFLQDPDKSEEEFSPVYDDGSFIGIEGSLFFDVLKNVSIRSNAFTRFYSLKNEEKPWHMPTFGIDAITSYTGGGDIYHVSLVLHAENGLPYRTPGGTETRLEPLLDLNLHGDYFFTSSLGSFLELNNLFGNNRERWAGYPSFGFNAKAGVMLRM